MTLGALPAGVRSVAGSVCACCGAKMMPYFSENAVISQNKINQLISESFLTVKGAALFLPRGNGSTSPSPTAPSRVSQRRNKHAGDLQQHLQTMFTLLRPEDNIRLAVRLESAYPQCTRYMVVVSTNGRQDTEESIVLGMDFARDSSCTVGLVLPLWSDTLIHLDGDGGFSVSTVNRVHVFKPVSVQAMWSALQSLHKACEVARCHNYYPGSLFLTWVSYYHSRITSDQVCINEWNAMQDVQSHRADSPVLFTDVPTERERTERLIKTRLREIMMQKDLENVTSKEIRTELEMQMTCNLREFKEFIDNEMIVILGQMDSPTEIFDHVFLGSEWNASNLEELQNSGVRYILNVTREIDNFFPGMFEYHNIRVYDEEATDLLAYWNDTYKFISKAKKAGAKCLVHCKMGVSRSASTVIAYAMKEYGWDLGRAFDYVKERRAVTKPNPSFMRQLEEYQGILLASKQRHNKLWRSHSDSDLSDLHEPLCKQQHSLGPRDTHNNNNNTPSLEHLLGMAVLQALTGSPGRADPDADPASPTLRDPFLEQHASNGLCELPLSAAGNPPPPSSPLQTSRSLPLPAKPRASTLHQERTDNSPLGPELKLDALPLPMIHVENTRAASPLPERKDSLHLPILVPDLMGNSQVVPEPGSARLQLALGEGAPNSPVSPETPMAVSPLSPLPAAHAAGLQASDDDDDDNNNNAAPPPSASSSLSTDSIDFFSAREKFLELSQDARARALSTAASAAHPEEQAASRTPHSRGPSQELPLPEDPSAIPPAEELPKDPLAPEAGCAVPRSQSENSVSVRDIVTELESITHPPLPPLVAAQRRSTGGGDSGEPSPPLLPPADLAPAAVEPQDCPSPQPAPKWPCGSVRRVTKELEQRLKQELDSPPPRRHSNPEPAPSADPARPGHGTPPSPHASPPPSPRTAAPVTHRPVSPAAWQASLEELEVFTAREEVENRDSTPTPDLCVCPEAGTDSFLPSCPQPPLPFLLLEGATENCSETDAPPAQAPPRLQRSTEELWRIQETLQELRAFLCEAGGRGGGAGAGEGTPGKVRQRTLEIEARIRQAGLTPPSLMKRSASLAKLGCLELSADDLSEWDPHRLCPAGPQQPRDPPEDASKKQRVVPRREPPPPRPSACLREQPSLPTSPLRAPASPERGEGFSLNTGDAPPPAPCLGALAARQQHGRTHPLRRLRKSGDKKRTASSLYNTM
ncbi:protein phosphatase Slingshot homolog 2 isoform X2 [Amia ocellicauda]|uniref:protein phosphatase Slingshot homolog 2 isoform X2 n=1 Tax=Amia ocellicauda TaxID=2972642 RepID=UPI003463AEA8